MKRIWKVVLWILGTLIVVVLAVLVLVFLRWANDLETVHVTEAPHVIYKDIGGNVAVPATGEGAVILDTPTLAMQGRAIRPLAE